MVHFVEDLAKFHTILAEAGDKLVVVDFTATWCGPCRMIGPKFEAMAVEPANNNVVFLKVDVDKAPDIVAEYGISSMPTFIFFKNGQQVDIFSGASEEKLKSKVAKYR